MSHKERILHTVLFELIILIIMATIATLFTDNGAMEMAGLAIVLSLIAMAWNYIYNYGYDKVLGADRSKRMVKTRTLHGIGFALGLMIISFPILMWALRLDFWTVLIADIGVVIFATLYAIGFNWLYDSIRECIGVTESVS